MIKDWEHRSGHRNQGAVFIEFTISVILIVLFIAGITEFGKLFAKFSNLSATAYNAVLIGGEQDTAVSAMAAESVFNILWGFQDDKGREIEVDTLAGSTILDGGGVTGNDMVRMSVTGKVKSEILNFSVPVSLSVSGSVLRHSPEDTTFGRGVRRLPQTDIDDHCNNWSTYSGYGDIGNCVGDCC